MTAGLTAEKIRRHRAFLSRDPVERPLIGSWLFGFYVHEQYPSVAAKMKPGPVRPEDIPIECFLSDVDALFAAYNELDDDYPLSMGAFYGIPWMEAIMGCPIFFSGTNMYSMPCIQNWDQYSWEKPGLDNPWARKLLEFLEALVSHAAGRFACGPTLMRGPADMCSAMRGGTNLALDLYDYPDKVERLAKHCADIWIRVGQAQLDCIPVSQDGYMVGCAGLRCWLPEKGLWLQDDAISLLSPRFYRELFLPQVQRIARAFPALAFHLHGNIHWPVDLLLEVDTILVQELNYDVGVCDFEKVLEDWKKIQARKPLIAYGDVTLEQLKRMQEELSPVGLSIQTLSPTVSSGIEKRNQIYEARQAI